MGHYFLGHTVLHDLLFLLILIILFPFILLFFLYDFVSLFSLLLCFCLFSLRPLASLILLFFLPSSASRPPLPPYDTFPSVLAPAFLSPYFPVSYLFFELSIFHYKCNLPRTRISSPTYDFNLQEDLFQIHFFILRQWSCDLRLDDGHEPLVMLGNLELGK